MHQVAEVLGVMVRDIEEKMPPDELIYWVAYFELKNAEMKKQAREMEQKSKARR